MLFKRTKKVRRTALALTCLLLTDNLLPLPAIALSGGPSQPEFTSFETASGGYTVNPFTGDFAWGMPVMEIPGAHGGGYALSLSYQSGVTPEQEASWVGFGWSLNPGAINREKRGFADDSNGDVVKYWNRVKRNWTVGISGSVGAEAFSADIPVEGTTTLRYNNQRGFSRSSGVGVTFADGLATLNYDLTDGESSFSYSLNVGAMLSDRWEKFRHAPGRLPIAHAALSRSHEKYMNKLSLNIVGGGSYGWLTHSAESRNMPTTKYTGESWNVSPALMLAPVFLQLGPDSRLTGSYSYQKNIGTVGDGSSDLNTYGYMYSGNAGPNDMMDYYVEKGGSYEKTDRFLGIPFANADQFNLSGEGLSGGFRVWNNRPGHFHPNAVKSTTVIHNLSFEAEAGANIGVGTTVGDGKQTLEMKGWDDAGNMGLYAFATSASLEDEAVFFRFNNDLGGEVKFTENDALLRGDVQLLNATPGVRTAKVDVPAAVKTKVNNGTRPGRSGTISWHTNEEMAVNDQAGGKKFKAITRDTQTNQWVKRDGSSNPISKGIGEFAITQQDGARYVYGLPVYCKNEYNLQYDLKGATVQNNITAVKNVSVEGNLEVKVGEERNTPYASSYLLTEITSPDYLDRTGNGPTSDDIGGYTKFNYTQAIGTPSGAMKNTGSWYKWRVPYNGLQVDRGSLSDPEDDMGSAQGGEKEIYYLSSVETRTHIAYFITGSTNTTVNGILLQGSGEQRLDGMEAADNVTASASMTAKGIKKLEKLERIELFAKNANGQPQERIKTVFFEYDYSLCTGIPNHLNNVPANPAAPNTGKLTLKRVWMEYGDVRESQISPWDFEYTYPQNVSAANPGYNAAGYPAVYQTAFGNYEYGSAQNPVYDAKSTDCWGHYQANGAARYSQFRSWMNQGTEVSGFDPAAWHLKVIKLPSGGQVHVQYESNTYSYVQDRHAMAMVSLSDATLINRFYLNTGDLGTLSTAEKQQMVNLMKEQFVDKVEKIYFKFYYKLLGATAEPVTSGSCNGDFITGYVTVESVGQDGTGMYVQLKNAPGGIEQLPRRVCKDFVQTQRAGKNVLTGNCDPDDGVDANGNPADAVIGFASYLVQMQTSIPGGGGSALSCIDLSEQDSYLRVPLPKPKQGAGVRVKRMLMYDAGIESGDQTLIGKEYLYEETNAATGIRTSYGVATTEPGTIREENALVGFMERFRQQILDRAVAGRDKETTEGPLGETILPGPSVGYSKVVVKDIHNGPTSSGFTTQEFFTCRDYPFDMVLPTLTDGNHSSVDCTTMDEERDWMVIPAGVVNISINNLWLSQGFRFVQNDMHGKPRSTSTYGGDYSNPASWVMSAREAYEYFEPGEEVPVLRDIHDDASGEHPGRETEVVMESKAIEDIYDNTNIEMDGDLGLLPVPVPFYSLFPSFTKSTNKLFTHVTSQVVRYPAIVKSVQRYTDGISTTTTTDAVSPWTGAAIVTSSPDEFDGLNLQQSSGHNGTVRSISLPAAGENPEMQGRYISERMMIRSGGADVLTKTASASQIALGVPASPSAGLVAQLQKLAPGDLVALYTAGTSTLDGVYHVKAFYESGKPFVLLPTTIYKFSGSPVTSALDLEVLRGGRSNMLSASMGSITTYGDPLPAVPGTNTMTGVVDANAVTFNDLWPYDTTVYGGWPLPAGSTITNVYERGERGRWKVEQSYTYRTSILPGNNESLTQPGYAGTQGRNYNGAGTFTDFVLFNWQNPSASDPTRWIGTSTATLFSPHGNASEEKNILDVYSCMKMGYYNTLPYLTATNVPYAGIQFETFENLYVRGSQYYLEDGLVVPSSINIVSNTAHSGAKSLLLTNTVQNFDLKQLSGVAGRTCVFRLWAREDYDKNGGMSVTVGQAHPSLRITFDGATGHAPLALTKVAQCGQWSLYEGSMTAPSAAGGGVLTPTVQYNTAVSGQQIWIDDVRVQPVESQAQCSVFDPVTHRLTASMNDQHFTTFFQYNEEGRLMRKIIETEEGRKTLEETQSNLPTVAR